MRLQSGLVRRIGSLAAMFALLAAPIAAPANDGKKGSLRERDDPRMIGKRNVGGGLNFYSREREAQIGRQLAAEIDRKAPLVTDPVVSEYVNRVGQNIALNSDAQSTFTIKVINSPDVNAFALPGGYLYINSGLLLAADNEAELAGVMAHEIAHVAARHGVRQASRGQLLQFLSIPLIFVGGVGGIIAQNAANLAVPLTFLKFSRGAEEEADRLGLQYMWASGYDPAAMLTFFEKLQAREKKEPGTLAKVFSSHPATGKRIEKASELLARFPERDAYTVTTSEFQTVKNRLMALTNQRVLDGDQSGAPTLKRQPRSEEGSDEKEPPTLKRRPEDS